MSGSAPTSQAPDQAKPKGKQDSAPKRSRGRPKGALNTKKSSKSPKVQAKSSPGVAAHASSQHGSGKPGRGSSAAQRKQGKAPERPPIQDLQELRGCFKKDLQVMMFGFGDARVPHEETVQLLEAIVIDYIADMTTKAVQGAGNRKLGPADFKFLVRRDPHKLTRADELLRLKEEIYVAKRTVEEKQFAQDSTESGRAGMPSEQAGDDAEEADELPE